MACMNAPLSASKAPPGTRKACRCRPAGEHLSDFPAVGYLRSCPLLASVIGIDRMVRPAAPRLVLASVVASCVGVGLLASPVHASTADASTGQASTGPASTGPASIAQGARTLAGPTGIVAAAGDLVNARTGAVL